MDLFQSMKISAAGLRAQASRMRVIAENLANANSTTDSKDKDPYRRKIPTFRQEFDRELQANIVRADKVKLDTTEFRKRYEPGHPAADERGYIKTPNINPLIETVDMREAQRSYEANLNVISAARRILSGTLDILRS